MKFMYNKKKTNIMNIIELQEKHEDLRNILIKYGCQEHGDVIIDEICSLFDYPQTTIYYKED